MNDVTPPQPSPSSSSRLVGLLLTRVVGPVAVIGLGLMCVGVMVALQADAEKAPPPTVIPVVETVTLTPTDEGARVQASGLVRPAQQVVIVPEVSGRITSIHNDLVPGGFFSRGDTLAQVDSRDYQAQLESAKTALKQAETELALERKRQQNAAKEWAVLGDGRPETDAQLALRKPQLALAEQSVVSAQSSVESAQRMVARTRLVAPFNAVVQAETIDVGQVVGPSTQAVTLIGTDRFWVEVSIPVRKLTLIDLPNHAGEQGSPVTVRQTLGDAGVSEWSGHVARLMGELDPQTRTAKLLIEVPRPYEPATGGVPLLANSWVDVDIAGKQLDSGLTVPRVAIDNGNQVWVVTIENTLERRSVTIGWRGKDTVTVTQGLQAGDKLVTSPLKLPVDGMAVKPAEES